MIEKNEMATFFEGVAASLRKAEAVEAEKGKLEGLQKDAGRLEEANARAMKAVLAAEEKAKAKESEGWATADKLVAEATAKAKTIVSEARQKAEESFMEANQLKAGASANVKQTEEQLVTLRAEIAAETERFERLKAEHEAFRKKVA